MFLTGMMGGGINQAGNMGAQQQQTQQMSGMANQQQMMSQQLQQQQQQSQQQQRPMQTQQTQPQMMMRVCVLFSSISIWFSVSQHMAGRLMGMSMYIDTAINT